MLTLPRFMGKRYPNKTHSWRNHLGASTGSSLNFSLEVTSSSSHQSSCRWQQHPGSGWHCFPGCPSALAAPLLWHYSQPCFAKQSWRSPKISEKAAFPYPSCAKKALVLVFWEIMVKSKFRLSETNLHCPFSLYTVYNAHLLWTPAFGSSVPWGKYCVFSYFYEVILTLAAEVF